MAFRRYRKYRKTYRKKPRFQRRFKRYGRSGRLKAGKKIHYFKRTFVQDCTITNSGWQGCASLGSSIETQLDNIASYAEFTALYDNYKICGIKKKFVFNRNSADTVTANHEIPQLITVNDFNDKTDLANEAEAIQYASYKAKRLDKVISRYYRPCIILSEQSAAGLLPVKSRWISTVDVDIEHFGLKWAVETIGTATGTTIGTLRVYTTLYLSFMGQK